MEHVTETDWARKEIVDAAIHHEWVGENEEECHFRGKVFPHFFVNHARARGSKTQVWRDAQGSYHTSTVGTPPAETIGGLGHLDIMDNRRKLAEVHVLARGDGWHMGWFGIKRLMRGHTFLGSEGIGQQINFEVYFTRFPVPNDPGAYFPQFWGSTPG